MYGLDSMEVDIGRTARGRRSASAGSSSAFFLSKLPMTGIYCEYLDTKAFGLLDIMISLHWQSRFFLSSSLPSMAFNLIDICSRCSHHSPAFYTTVRANECPHGLGHGAQRCNVRP